MRHRRGSQTQLALLTTLAMMAVMGCMLMVIITSGALRNNKNVQTPVAAIEITVSHADQRFFGAKVRVVSDHGETAIEFPSGTARASDENPSQSLALEVPKGKLYFLSLDLQDGRHFAYALDREQKIQLDNPLSLSFEENDKPSVAIADGPRLYADRQPKQVEFYAYNHLFEGAEITIKNEDGKVLRLHMSTLAAKQYRHDDPQAKVTKDVPADFDLTRTYTVRIHFRDGHISRYRFYRIGDGERTPAFYFHTCNKFPTVKDPYGLRPRVFLNWVETEVSPDRL